MNTETNNRAVFVAGPSREVRNDYPADYSKRAYRYEYQWHAAQIELSQQCEQDRIDLSRF